MLYPALLRSTCTMLCSATLCYDRLCYPMQHTQPTSPSSASAVAPLRKTIWLGSMSLGSLKSERLSPVSRHFLFFQSTAWRNQATNSKNKNDNQNQTRFGTRYYRDKIRDKIFGARFDTRLRFDNIFETRFWDEIRDKVRDNADKICMQTRRRQEFRIFRKDPDGIQDKIQTRLQTMHKKDPYKNIQTRLKMRSDLWKSCQTSKTKNNTK